MDGNFDPRTADGRDAVMIVLALTKAGQDVVVRPASLASGLPAAFTDLLTKSGEGQFDLALSVGPVTLPGWSENARTKVVWSSHPGQSVCDLVLATDPDAQVFLTEHARRENVAFCPLGFDPEVWPEIDREGDVNIGVVSGSEPVTKIWAEQERKGHLMYMPGGLTVPERIQFYASIDVLVSLIPSRHAERSLQEFMATGGSGAFPAAGLHRNLLNGAWYEIGIRGEGLGALFTELETEHARTGLNRKGESGRRAVSAEFGWKTVVEKVLERSLRVM